MKDQQPPKAREHLTQSEYLEASAQDGVHVPVSLESVASVVIAGQSTFKMTYEYESINGRSVGTPDATR